LARDTNFYYSFLVLTPAKRQAIIAVWDFCRAVDDAVDEVREPGDAAVEVARWRREVADCFEGRAPQTRQGRALAPLIKEFGLTRQPFESLIEGVEMDRLMLAGSSPRGMMTLLRAARVHAWLEGRTHLVPDDVAAVFPSAMVHRLFFTPLYEMRRVAIADALVAQILQRVPTPR